MTILKRKSGKDYDQENDKICTIYLPPPIFNYLALFTYAHSITKTSILKAIIEDWMGDTILEEPPDKLIKRIGKRALDAWKEKKARHPGLSLFNFKKQLIHELEWKGVTPEQIKTILIIFNNGTR